MAAIDPKLPWPKRWRKVYATAKNHRFAQRNELIARLTIHYGLRATELCSLRFCDVDLAKRRLHCPSGARTGARSVQLDDHVLSLMQAMRPDAPDGKADESFILRTKGQSAMTRVDVWRVLHRLGDEAKLATPFNTRRARRALGHLTAGASRSDAVLVAQRLGIQTLDAVDGYLPRRRRKRKTDL